MLARHNGNFAGKSAQWVLLPRSSNGSSERSRLQSAQLLSLRPSTPYIDVGIIPATPDWNDSPVDPKSTRTAHSLARARSRLWARLCIQTGIRLSRLLRFLPLPSIHSR